jgi:hypothetical protein
VSIGRSLVKNAGVPPVGTSSLPGRTDDNGAIVDRLWALPALLATAVMRGCR